MKSILEKLSIILTKKQNVVFILGIVFVAAFWRLYRLNQIPQGLNQDEYGLVNYLINLSKNGWKLDIEYLYQAVYLYLFAAIGYVVKFNVLALRIAQAVIGAFSVFLFYQLVRNWFNRQTALLAGLFLATSSFHVLFSRNLEPQIFIPLIITLVLLILTNAFRTNNLWLFLLAGLFSGLAFYIDKVFSLLPFIFLIIAIYFFFKNKKFLTGYKKGLFILIFSTLLVAVPYLYFLPKFFNKIVQAFNPGSIGQYYLNLGNNLQSLFHESLLNNVYNVGTEPIFDPFITIAFICGLIYALFYLRRKKFLILLNWFLGGVVLISFYANQASVNYILVLLPVFTLAAIMLDYVLTHWVRTFPFNKAARLLMTILFSTFLFMSIFYNYQKYFWAWGRNDTIQQNYQHKIDYQR